MTQSQNLSDSSYARERKALLEFVQRLRACGAQAILDVPRVVVIGNQSAGKSSVVEAISGITVPRDAGTCTRCPMECRMASADTATPWRCRISIRYEYDGDGKKAERVREVPFGDIITNKSDVELALRRAQYAVLNPHHEPSSFLSLSAKQIKDGMKNGTLVPFSKNIVCIDLEGPGLIDLSFIDLPGLIQVAENAAVVQLVESLVVEHIQGQSLILVTVPMTDDLDNQKALALARKADPEGKRTIGVLTKADAVPKGSKAREQWLEVIEGRNADKGLLHGYFCTRQPDDLEREQGTTPAGARQAETDFFSKTEPWSKSSHRHRFGTERLVNTMSSLLERVIKEAIPQIDLETNAQLAYCELELARLPPPLKDEPLSLVYALVSEFTRDIMLRVQGVQGELELVQKCKKIFEEFKLDIRDTAPKYVARPRAKPRSGSYVVDKNKMDLDDMREHIERCLARQLPGNVPFEAKVELIVAFQDKWRPSANTCILSVRDLLLSALLKLADIHFGQWDYLRRLVRACINELIEDQVEKCADCVQTILEIERTAYTQNTHYLQTSTDKWLSEYRAMRKEPVSTTSTAASSTTASTTTTTPTSATSSATSVSHGSGAAAAVLPASFSFGAPSAGSALGGNSGGLFGSTSASSPQPTKSAFGTISAAASSSQPANSQSAFARLSNAASALPAKPSSTRDGLTTATLSSQSTRPDGVLLPISQDILDALATLTKAGYPVTAKDLSRLAEPDIYETEMVVMSEVRGYFQVAYKRVIDSIPMHVDHILLHQLKDRVQLYLQNYLKLGTENGRELCAKYLSEDADVVRRRQEMTSQKATLEAVKRELYKFAMSIDAPLVPADRSSTVYAGTSRAATEDLFAPAKRRKAAV